MMILNLWTILYILYDIIQILTHSIDHEGTSVDTYKQHESNKIIRFLNESLYNFGSKEERRRGGECIDAYYTNHQS